MVSFSIDYYKPYTKTKVLSKPKEGRAITFLNYGRQTSKQSYLQGLGNIYVLLQNWDKTAEFSVYRHIEFNILTEEVGAKRQLLFVPSHLKKGSKPI